MSNESDKDSGRHMLRAVMASIILVNIISVYGQVLWFFKDEHLPLIGAVGAAISLESIALALASMAHHAMLAGDSSWSLAGGSRGMSIIAGLLNLSHYSPHGITHPSTLGIVFGLLSSSSGFMWGAYARRMARDKFMEQGVIERRTVKVGMPMWALYPKDALERLRVGVWHGENRLSEVRRLVAEKRERETRERAVIDAEREAEQERMTLETAKSQADAIRIAVAHLGDDATNAAVVEWLSAASPRPWKVSSARVRQVRASMAKSDVVLAVVRADDQRSAAVARRATVRALPSGEGASAR